MTRDVFLFVVVLAMLAISSPAMAQMISDDDDSYIPESGTETVQDGQPDQFAADAEVLKFGVLRVKPTYEAKEHLGQGVLDKVYSYLLKATDEVNVGKKEVLAHEKVMKSVSSRGKILFEKCWIDQDCLSIALKPVNLDMVIASKISLVKIGNLGKQSSFADEAVVQEKVDISADYTLFIRIIDTKNQKVLKEILVNHTDPRRLPELGLQEYRKALVELSLIVDDPSLFTEKDGNFRDGLDATDIIGNAPAPMKNKELKIAAFTTLGLGIVAEGLGLTMGLLSNKAQKDAENAATIGSVRSNNKDSKNYALAANILYGAGGGLLISSVVLFVLGYSDDGYGSGGGEFDIDEPIQPKGSVTVTPDGFYLQARARF